MKNLFILLVLAFINAINHQAHCESKHIFLLAGQSNMAGLGGVAKRRWDHVVPEPECIRNPNIFKLNAALNWEPAEEPLHAGIDIRTNGIGPGMPFANSLLRKLPDYGVIGLVPCAISGTRIVQWQKGTDLYHMLLSRAQAAVKQNGNDSSTIEALLWYQGESDTKNERDAYAYKGRLEQFITDLRTDLNLPHLLIIQVVLASGKKEYLLEVVRKSQLHIVLPNVKCVDAMGLALEDDNLHLTTSAQVRLGNMLSDAFIDYTRIDGRICISICCEYTASAHSNMAGLGGVVKNKWDHLVPPESSPNPNILKLNAELLWEVAEEPLHSGIDTNVTNGIGPGMPFANSLLQTIPDYGIIGLVPCAISGTKIIDWQKGTIFYNQLVDRAMVALQNDDGSFNTIDALLWYQGESDTMSQADANAYKGRLQQFIIDLRADLNLPNLLIIEVALASGGKNYIDIVRQAQLNTELPNVRCVDARGLPLQRDKLHLNTTGQIQLGNLLTDAFISPF
ncbi:OLC1v1031825C1 [Oldenlandia corymbosa var. corymbosa]|uniref:OLC1v1031825C1 n=1 Tax=Oldenlandia corymbosa var. corymbosa TaxID=529605 RepID=A0AAV1CJF2_OLDCO|nr:OLC1v1031825C1 [Oldenlandia corymbosa var. corymbosa]